MERTGGSPRVRLAFAGQRRLPPAAHPDRWYFMRSFRTCCLIGLIGSFILGVSGCVSHRLGQSVGEAVLAQVLAEPIELAFWVGIFREANRRWPGDYADLVAFSKRSGTRLQLTNYTHIDFKEKTNGMLEVCAVGPQITNRMTFSPAEASQK